MLFRAFSWPAKVGVIIIRFCKNDFATVSSHDNISERQIKALHFIAKGFSNQEIAKRMDVTQSTVKTHISLLLNLFEADNRSHCVAEARRLGFEL